MAASGPVRTPSGDPPDVLAAVRDEALELSRLLLSLDPVLGEPRLQRSVDAFVEQAADALRALARYAALPDSGDGMPPSVTTRHTGWSGAAGAQSSPDAAGRPDSPGAWRW